MITAIAISLAVTFPQSTATAGVPQTRMFDWNSAGYNLNYGKGRSSWLYETLFQSIQSRGAAYPGIITLQEVCRQQAQVVQPFMNTKGYGVYAMYDASNSVPCENVVSNAPNTFGNVVWVYGSGQIAWASSPFPAAHQTPSSYGELRGIACVRSTFYGIHACSTHLTPSDRRKADCQLGDAMYYIYGTYASGERAVIGGDFNIDSFTTSTYPNPQNAPSIDSTPGPQNKCDAPFAAPGQLWDNPTQIATTYNNFWEADQAGGIYNRRATSSEGKKIDYIFILKGWGDYAAPLSITSSASDHKLLEAYLRY